MELGLVDLEDFSVDELKKFARDLDVIVTKSVRDEYIEDLRKEHAKGVTLLAENDGHEKKRLTCEHLQQLQKQNINKLGPQKLRYFAKRVGIKNTLAKGKTELLEDIKIIEKERYCSYC